MAAPKFFKALLQLFQVIEAAVVGHSRLCSASHLLPTLATFDALVTRARRKLAVIEQLNVESEQAKAFGRLPGSVAKVKVRARRAAVLLPQR